MKKRLFQTVICLYLFTFCAFAQQGQTLNFNESANTNVSLSNNIQLLDSFTIETWIYPEMKGDFSTIIGNKSPGIASSGYFLAINNYGTSNGKIVFETQNMTNVSVNSVVWDQWQHIALTWNGNLARIYINGVLQQMNDSLNMNLVTSASPCYLGDIPAYVGNGNFKGNIDELRVWNYARSQQDIQNNMYCQLSQIPNSLTLYYQFNEGIAGGSNSSITTIPDLSNNNNTGNLANFALSGMITNWIAPGAVSNITAIQNITSCDGTSIVIGTHVYSSNGTFIDTLTASNGCDSVLTSTLTFQPISTSSQSFTICGGDSIVVGNSIYFNSGIYTDNFTNAIGCDSIVSTTLTVNTPNVTVTQIGNMLQADSGATAYQWVICDSLFTNVLNETNVDFYPSIAGSYAVIVTLGTCTSQSVCMPMLLTAITENLNLKLSLFPNPASTLLILQNVKVSEVYRITSLQGIIVKEFKIMNDTEKIDISNLSSGMYFISNGLNQNSSFIKN